MQIDLASMSRQQLEELKNDIEKQLEHTTKEELRIAREAAAKAAAEHGFKLSEIMGEPGTGRGKGRTPGVARFANPSDPAQTWTGKGRQPQWYKDAVAAGRSPEEMAL